MRSMSSDLISGMYKLQVVDELYMRSMILDFISGMYKLQVVEELS
jgi:hypothetical protein